MSANDNANTPKSEQSEAKSSGKSGIKAFINDLLIIIGVVATVVSCAIGFLTFLAPKEAIRIINQIYEPTKLAEDRVIVVTALVPPEIQKVEITRVVEVTREVIITATPLPKPSDTQTPMATPTYAATSTYTNTPTPTATPIPPIFWDTFDSGIKPEWIVINGQPGIVNKEFTAQTDTVWLSLSLPAEVKNYKIEFDALSLGGCGSPGMIIAPVFSDVRNYLGYFSTPCQDWWSIVIDGNERKEYLQTGYKAGTHYQFVVQANYVTIFIDGVESGSVFNNVIAVGKIGLYMYAQVRIDNLLITSLP